MRIPARSLTTSKSRLLPALVLGMFLAAANAQEDETPAAEPDAAAETPEDANETPPADDEIELGPDDPLLDAQGFDPNDDDDFIPSEDIPADAPIAFPTDI